MHKNLQLRCFQLVLVVSFMIFQVGKASLEPNNSNQNKSETIKQVALAATLQKKENYLASLQLPEKAQKIILYFIVGYDALINLGGNCQVAHQMYVNDLRLYALPFDTLITPFTSLHKLLQNKFDDFFNRANLAYISSPEKYVIDHKYGTRMIHDFKLSEDFMVDYDAIKTKYDRRINRFLELIKTSERLLFIRIKITRQEAIELDKLLQATFPGLEYTILALDMHDDIKTDWQLARIKNFHVKQPEPYVWRGDNQAWKTIFEACGLSPLPALSIAQIDG